LKYLLCGSAFRCCCSVLPDINESTSTRLMFAAILFTGTIISVIMMSPYLLADIIFPVSFFHHNLYLNKELSVSHVCLSNRHRPHLHRSYWLQPQIKCSWQIERPQRHRSNRSVKTMTLEDPIVQCSRVQSLFTASRSPWFCSFSSLWSSH